MSRIIGLDYGMKRTGIAVTDSLQIIVNPLDVIATKELYEFLSDYLEAQDVEELVIGEPKQMDGSPTYIEKDIQKLIVKIKEAYPDIVISRQDESFTSLEAKDLLLKMGLKKKKRQDKSMLDKVSAVLILQRYLNHI